MPRFSARHLASLALSLSLPACGGGYGATYPTGGGTGGGGGPVGAVTVGPGLTFTSRHNGTINDAVDTVTVGGAVTWTWNGTDQHSVESVGTTTFASSPVKNSGTYVATFATAGTYRYQCAVHGSAMTGRVVVLAAGQYYTSDPNLETVAGISRTASH
jgi:plastocyanin